ncbi:hypothetical protein RJ641_022168 [Dillenia turbinata]|uniref:NUP210 Ig-like domain-containing protein n=1 Tax=Dillenia turbinata TaxID=194707 RepID=A0AAN8ULX1_9MAGN
MWKNLQDLNGQTVLIPETDGLPSNLAHVPLKASPLSDCGGLRDDQNVQIKLEAGVFCDLFVVKGTGIGHEIVSVHLHEQKFEYMAGKIVVEPISIDPPSPVFVLIGFTIYYSLKVLGKMFLKVGLSGGGKSMPLNPLLCSYVPTVGKILVDGFPHRELGIRRLFKLLDMIVKWVITSSPFQEMGFVDIEHRQRQWSELRWSELLKGFSGEIIWLRGSLVSQYIKLSPTGNHVRDGHFDRGILIFFFNGSWDHHDVLDVLAEYNTSNHCSTNARLRSIAPYSGRKETVVYAADVNTGTMMHCIVFIDNFSRIQIFHNSIKLDLDGLYTLHVHAFDGEATMFSSLIGLQFMWHLIPKTDGLPANLALVPLKTSHSDCGELCCYLNVQIKLEEAGVICDLLVVKGTGIGHEIVSVHLREPKFEYVAVDPLTCSTLAEHIRVADHMQTSSLHVVLPDTICLYLLSTSASGIPVDGVEGIPSGVHWSVVSGKK